MPDITPKLSLLQGCDKDKEISHFLKAVLFLKPISKGAIQMLAQRLDIQPSMLDSLIETAQRKGDFNCIFN